MTTIGTAVLQIVPSLDGVSSSIDKQLGGKFGAAGKKAGKDFAKGAGDGLKDLQKEVETAAKAYQKLHDKAADSLGKIRTEEEKLKKLRESGASGDRIVAAEERLAKARRDGVRSGREAADGLKALHSAQRDLSGGVDDAAGKFAGLSSAMTTAGAVAAGAALAGIAALAAGVVVAGRALYDLGAQFDDISDSFVVKLGATGDKLAALNQQVSDLGPTMALPLTDIGSIVADVNRRLDGSTTELENVAQAVGDLNRMTGSSTDIRKFGQLIAQWNIPAQDQVKTLDLLFNASRKAGVPVNDLMETLTGKGAVALRELNIPLDEAAGLMLRLQESGLDTAGSIDALAKAQKAAAKDGKDLNTELTDTFNQIKNAPSQNAADKVGFATFGKNAGPITEAIRNGTLTLKDFFAVMEAGGPTIAETAALTDDFGEKWQKLKNRLEVAIKPIATGVFDTINSKLSELGDWASAHQDQVILLFQRIGDAAISGAQAILHFAADSLRALSTFVGGARDALKPLFDAMANIGSVLQYVPGFTDMGRAMKVIGEGGQKLSDAFEQVPGTLNKGADALDNVATKLDGAKNWWDGYTNRAAEAVKLTQSLGDTVRAVLNEKGEIEISSTTPEVEAALTKLGIHVQHLPDGKLVVTANTDEGTRIINAWRDQQTGKPVAPVVRPDMGSANQDMRSFIDKWTAAIISPSVKPSYTPGDPGSVILPGSGRAAGGRISGAGTGTSDSILARVSTGEYIVNADATRKNLPLLEIINSGTLPGYAGGGAVSPDVAAAQRIAGTPYSQSQRFDCSGTVARVILAALGQTGGLMTTKTAAEWLAARGFVAGVGGRGMISVGWYDHGGGPNSGHMAMTLSDGRHAEAGGSNSVFTVGAAAAGADSPQFDHHMYLPTVFGEGPAGTDTPAAAGVTGPTTGEGTPTSSGGGTSLPSSISGLSAFGLNALGTGAGTTKSGSDLSVFGQAAGAAVSGQVSSALNVFGVGDQPPFLQAAAKLISGISVSDSNGRSLFNGASLFGGQGAAGATPVAATPVATGTPPPDGVRNIDNSGQQPGVVYNIAARDTEDAFIRAQRLERERAAAKLSRY